MQIGMVGLGRMGSNMALRLLRQGHDVVACDTAPEALQRAEEQGAKAAPTLRELVDALDPPRVVWLMIPAGTATEGAIAELGTLLEAGDTLVDGGNTRYTDSIRHAEELGRRGIAFVDAGTSGGIWGLEQGFCLMVGGDEGNIERLRPIFDALAQEGGFAHVGPVGAGHFVKMIHNGIEYGLMQSYGEGFELLAKSGLGLDLAQIAELWRHGSVVRSWLLDLAAQALAEDPQLSEVSDYVEDSGEGRWTLETAIDSAVPAPALASALFARFASRQDESFAGKMIAALRKGFGGHAIKTKSGP